MTSSIANCALGSCKITYKSTDLGWTTPDGVTVSQDGHTFVPLIVDEYGKTPMDYFDVGIEKFFVKFELLELTHANRALVMPFATALSGHTMTESGIPSGSIASKCGTLNIHPRLLGATNYSADINVHKCLAQWKGDFQQGIENVKKYTIECVAIPDTSKSTTNQLWSIGGASS